MDENTDLRDVTKKAFLVLRKRCKSLKRLVSSRVGGSALADATLFTEIANKRSVAMQHYVQDDDADVASASQDSGSSDDAAPNGDPALAVASAVISDGEGSASGSDDSAEVAPSAIVAVDQPRQTRAEAKRAKQMARYRQLARQLSMPDSVGVTITWEGESDWEFDVLTRSPTKASPAMELDQRNVDKLINTLAADAKLRSAGPKQLPGIARKTAMSNGYF